MLSKLNLATIKVSSRNLRWSKNSISSNVRKLSTGTGSTAAEEIARYRPVGYWLLGVSGLIAGIVTVGGITRLTRSGLSMTDWKLQGSLPPMNDEEWEKEFARYKTFPEWNQRQSMTVEEFKYIYFWEYGHRMMGRFIGVAFTLPALYFGARGMIPKHLYKRMGLLFALGGGQGLIGWWMVKSGLEMDPEQKKEIRVSPYRLATHLCMAFTTFFATFWTALDILNPTSKAIEVAKSLPKEVLQVARKSRKFALHNVGLVGLTVLSGAYVAGNDAGNCFNTWPKMGEEWIPSEIFDYTPLWRNFTENCALVQLDHRLLAYSTIGAVTMMYAGARRALGGAYWAALPPRVRLLYNAGILMAGTQVALGITTLLTYVHLHVAATHQFGSLVLLSLTTALAHSLNFAKHAPGSGSIPVTGAGLSALKMMTGSGVMKSSSMPVVRQMLQKHAQKKL